MSTLLNSNSNAANAEISTSKTTTVPNVATVTTTAAATAVQSEVSSNIETSVGASTRLVSLTNIAGITTTTDNNINVIDSDSIHSNGNSNDNGNCFSLSLMQSSPPPHSYRHSRAYRHFKNPPQPHMCIRTTTEAGEELFINVLSWTRIVIPQEPSDPIPLYGGMRVPPGSPRSPPIVFAVMANPEVLKDSGRHSKDPEERRAMVELMCDFVEAMNPGVKLVRNAVILKDRDISGELKDVWNAVQAQRDREREEQLLQQRQQQHYHNVTTQQMFPKATEAVRINQQRTERENTLIKMSPEKSVVSENRTAVHNVNVAECTQLDNRTTIPIDERDTSHAANGMSAYNTNNITESNTNSNRDNVGKSNSGNNKFAYNAIESKDQIDANNCLNAEHELNAGNLIIQTSSDTPNGVAICGNNRTNTATITATPTSPPAANKISVPMSTTNTTNTTTVSATASILTPTATTPVPTTTATKKEKLGGFLPNGCIFPRFKNNRHKEKDKDKEKEKETKSKDKEKTLLNALKKNKEKKVVPIEHSEKTIPQETDAKSNYDKNCINLENEVQKLDLNKIDTTSGNENNMFIKLKVTATSAAAK